MIIGQDTDLWLQRFLLAPPVPLVKIPYQKISKKKTKHEKKPENGLTRPQEKLNQFINQQNSHYLTYGRECVIRFVSPPHSITCNREMSVMSILPTQEVRKRTIFVTTYNQNLLYFNNNINRCCSVITTSEELKSNSYYSDRPN